MDRNIKRLNVVEENKGYWRVIINNPPFNNWDPYLFAELNVLMDDMEKNKELKVVVFESANEDFFIDHHDVEHRLEVPDVPGAKPFFHEWPAFVSRLVNLPVLSISKVRGRAWAQGFEFALATDMIFASKEKAKFSLIEVGGNSIPGGGGVEWLSALCGRAKALEIVLSADEYSADLGVQYGFVNRSLPDTELDEFVDKFARRIASFPKRSLYVGKKLVNAHAYAPSEATLFTSNYILHAFDDWQEGRAEYPKDGKEFDFSKINDIRDLELNFPAKLGPDEK